MWSASSLIVQNVQYITRNITPTFQEGQPCKRLNCVGVGSLWMAEFGISRGWFFTLDVPSAVLIDGATLKPSLIPSLLWFSWCVLVFDRFSRTRDENKNWDVCDLPFQRSRVEEAGQRWYRVWVRIHDLLDALCSLIPALVYELCCGFVPVWGRPDGLLHICMGQSLDGGKSCQSSREGVRFASPAAIAGKGRRQHQREGSHCIWVPWLPSSTCTSAAHHPCHLPSLGGTASGNMAALGLISGSPRKIASYAPTKHKTRWRLTLWAKTCKGSVGLWGIHLYLNHRLRC